MKSLEILFSIAILSLLLIACGQQSVPPSAPVDVEISVRVEPEPLAVGDTTLIVMLTDASGSPIDGARLQVHGDMDHEGMVPVDREINESNIGEYRVPFKWTMGGGWIVTVTAHLPGNGGEVSQDFEFFVEAISSESIINRYGAMNMDTEATSESTSEVDFEHSGMDMDMSGETTSEAMMNMADEDLPINITYEPDNDPAIGGDATVTILLTDRSGDPITDASVEITGDMAHEGMMPIFGTGEHAADGEYTVPVRWTMAGDWQVKVKVTRADGSIVETTFDQQVVLQGR